MNRFKKITALLLAGLMTLSVSGCGGTGADPQTATNPSASSEAPKEDISNREEFGTAYELTAIFAVAPPEVENKPVSTTSAFVYADITDCGDLNTFNMKFNLPEITGEAEVEYFSPVICKSEVTEVKLVNDESGKEDQAVTETTVKVGDTETKAFIVRHAGTYEVTIGEETLPLTVKSGSLYLDTINEMEAPNILVNTASDDFKERGKEYDTVVPALVRSYMDKFKDEDQTLAALKMDNAVFLKEYNRIRKLRGDDILSAEDMVKAYKDYKVNDKDVLNAPNRRGFREKIAALRKIDLTAAESTTKKDDNKNNTNKNNTNSSSAAGNTNNNSANSAPAPAVTSGGSGAEAMSYINDFRAQYGLPPFSWYGEGVANIRAGEIVSNFSHNSASGQDCYGENICMEATGTARNAVNMWINSPGHRANLLDPVCTRGAVGVVKSGGWYYWSMNIWR